MEAPILPVEGVNQVIYEGDFVRKLQSALRARGYFGIEPAIYPPIEDGQYGPRTAAALRAFQRDHPVSTWRDQIYGLVGFKIASCATYNALGLNVHRVFPIAVPGIIDQSLVDAIIAAEREGRISLNCPGVPEPIIIYPPEQQKQSLWGYIAVGIGAAIITALVIALVGKR